MQFVKAQFVTYIKELGFFFFLRMAVAVSSSWFSVSSGSFATEMANDEVSTSFFSAPEASLKLWLAIDLKDLGRRDILEVDLGLVMRVFRLFRHIVGRVRMERLKGREKVDCPR